MAGAATTVGAGAAWVGVLADCADARLAQQAITPNAATAGVKARRADGVWGAYRSAMLPSRQPPPMPSNPLFHGKNKGHAEVVP